eukprot:TRINITY_DN1511_c1_g1_i1.p1 TRINITY_DN1511_c1_g1~~TRINITY_DN1511_c1_g1_i1.p1  ORF type:complete len:431 (-),score=108.41 TRINITY_DN1511_c1_g1_i1:62-1354(-)
MEDAAGHQHNKIEIPVGKTCLYTCAERAVETRRPQPIFDDPLSVPLAGEVGFELLGQFHGLYNGTRKDAINASVVIRTKFFDDFVVKSCTESGVKQIVIIAAGMDSRVYRLPLGEDYTVWELDFAEVFKYKESRIKGESAATTSCKHTLLGVDLTLPGWEEKLSAAGYDPHVPSLWLIEGLLVYLKDEHIDTLLQRISRIMATGSYLAGDWMNRAYISSPLTAPFRDVFASFGSPFINGSDAIPDLFGKHGFHVELKMLGEEGANWSDRVPSNQVKVAAAYPVSDPAFDFLPRHLIFYGQRTSDNKQPPQQQQQQQQQQQGVATTTTTTALSLEEATRVVSSAVKRVLGLDESDDISHTDSLFCMGVGSFEVVDIAHTLQQALSTTTPTTIPSESQAAVARQLALPLDFAMRHNTISQLAAALVGKSASH